MRYLSICSGIEAASVAWGRLGWKPAAFAEIDKFPSAVLKHRYPTVRNLGDFTKIESKHVGSIDVLVGGTPCQSFSVAGLRGGMADDRGNLALEFCRLALRTRPRWIVWENVPGVLSSNEGRDFGSFLGALGKCGYGFAYRVLDAQFVRVQSHPLAVPQRRRRVFVVGYLGDWRPPAAVLFERESMCGHPPPSRKARQDVVGSLASRTSAGGGLGTDFELAGGVVSHSLNAKGGTGRIDAESETFVAGTLRSDHSKSGNHEQLVASTLAASDGGVSSGMHPVVAHSLRGEGFDASEDGTGRGTPLVFDTTQITNPDNRSQPEAGNPCHTLASGQHAPAVAFGFENRSRGDDGRGYDRPPHFAEEVGPTVGTVKEPSVAGATVRRLTPRECERLQGFPDDYTLVPYRGKPAKDGPRYKAIGNSMAVNVIYWIGKRIDAVNRG